MALSCGVDSKRAWLTHRHPDATPLKGFEMTEWILRGGEVVDGSGRPRRRADVAIAGDRIAEVGAVGKVAGAREIDVTGKIVAPGFIDVHTHDDRALLATPDMAAKASQGVTTVVTGNCGVSLAPLVLEGAPPPPLDLIGDAANYHYARFADYLASQDHRPREFRPYRRDPARDRRGDRPARSRARRLPLHRFLDGAECRPGRARLEGPGDLVEERPRRGRPRACGNRRRLGRQPEEGGRSAAAGGCRLLDDGRGRCAAGAAIRAHDDRLGRAAARHPPAPAAVGCLPARPRLLQPRARPLQPRGGGAPDDRAF